MASNHIHQRWRKAIFLLAWTLTKCSALNRIQGSGCGHICNTYREDKRSDACTVYMRPAPTHAHGGTLLASPLPFPPIGVYSFICKMPSEATRPSVAPQQTLSFISGPSVCMAYGIRHGELLRAGEGPCFSLRDALVAKDILKSPLEE